MYGVWAGVDIENQIEIYTEADTFGMIDSDWMLGFRA